MRWFGSTRNWGIVALMVIFCLCTWRMAQAETDVTDKVQLIKSRLGYDRLTQTSYLNVGLQNVSQDAVATPLKAIIESISTPAVTVANPDGITEDGKPFFEYGNVSGELAPGETTITKLWSFDNPTVARFTYVVSVQSVEQTPPNSPPIIEEIAGIFVNEGETVIINPMVHDPDGDNVVITYSGWMSSEHYDTTFDDAGTHSVTVVATDEHGAQSSREVVVTVNNVNRPPEMRHILPIYVLTGETFSISVEATDPDGDSIAVSYSGWITTNTYTPSEDDIGCHIVSITVDDGNGGTVAQEVSITVSRVSVIKTFTAPADEGAIFRGSDGSPLERLTVKIPEGALPVEQVLEVGIVESPPEFRTLGSGMGKVYFIGPAGIAFDAPVTIEIQYDENDFKCSGVVAEELLQIYSFSEGDHAWRSLENVRINPEQNVIRAETTHLSNFTVNGDKLNSARIDEWRRYADSDRDTWVHDLPGGISDDLDKIFFPSQLPYDEDDDENSYYLLFHQSRYLPVVFIHGFLFGLEGDSESTFGRTGEYLMRLYDESITSKENPDLWFFNYDTNHNIHESAYSLYLAIQKIKYLTGAPKVLLVAHSLGGLVARTYVESYASTDGTADGLIDYQQDVQKFMMLGTPNHGANLVKILDDGLDEIGSEIIRHILRLPWWVPIPDVLGELILPASAEQMHPDSFFLGILNGEDGWIELPMNIEYSIVYGRIHELTLTGPKYTDGFIANESTILAPEFCVEPSPECINTGYTINYTALDHYYHSKTDVPSWPRGITAVDSENHPGYELIRDFVTDQGAEVPDWRLTLSEIEIGNPVQENSVVSVPCQIRNDGLVAFEGTIDLQLLVDGIAIPDTASVQAVAAGTTETADFNWIAVGPGQAHTLEVIAASDDGKFNARRETTVFVASADLSSTTPSILVNGRELPDTVIVQGFSSGGLVNADCFVENGTEAVTFVEVEGTGVIGDWVEFNGDPGFVLQGDEAIQFDYMLRVPEGIAPGEYVGGVRFSCGETLSIVLPIRVSVTECESGICRRDFDDPIGTIDGRLESSRWLLYRTTDPVDNDDSTPYPTKRTGSFTLSTDEYVRLIPRGGRDLRIAAAEEIPRTDDSGIGFGINEYFVGPSKRSFMKESFDSYFSVLSKLKPETNNFSIGLDNFYHHRANTSWTINAASLGTSFSRSVWHGKFNPGDAINEWAGGLDYIRLYALVSSVIKEGDLHLYNNGYLVDTTDVEFSDAGETISFIISLGDLEDSNWFIIKGSPGDETQLQLEDIRLEAKVFTGEPHLIASRTASSSEITVGEAVTISLEIENAGGNISDGYSFTDLPLPEGLDVASGQPEIDSSHDIDPQETTSCSYTVTANEIGNFVVGASTVKYRNLSGDDFEVAVNPVLITVNGGLLNVSADIPETVSINTSLPIVAQVTVARTGDLISDADVVATVDCGPLGLTELQLTYDPNFDGYRGQWLGESQGVCELVVRATHQFYLEGSVAATFTVNDPMAFLDTDGDTILNINDPDDDNDGMPDEWECLYGLDPLVNDAWEDPDGDGYANIREYQFEMNPEVDDVWEMKLVTVDEQGIPGTQGVESDNWPAISYDGRFVSFMSSSLLLNDSFTNIYIRDLHLDDTENIYCKDIYGIPLSFSAREIDMSSDARFMVFTSSATDLVEDLSPCLERCFYTCNTYCYIQAYLYDRQLDTIEMISLDNYGNPSLATVYYPKVSNDGRFVIFTTEATNILGVPESERWYVDSQIIIRDINEKLTSIISLSPNGELASQNCEWSPPSISNDGRYVAFTTGAENLVANEPKYYEDSFVYDRENSSMRQVNISSEGIQDDGMAYYTTISGNGRYVAFSAYYSTIIDNVEDGIFVHDLETGETQLVSISPEGLPFEACEWMVSLSDNGERVAFTASLDGSYGSYQIYVRDIKSMTTIPVSVSLNGDLGDGDSWFPTISGDGRYVAFITRARNFPLGDQIDRWDHLYVSKVIRPIEDIPEDYDDNDGDGILNWEDADYSTALIDLDLDGVPQSRDLCPGTQRVLPVDSDGCPIVQLGEVWAWGGEHARSSG